MTGLLWKSPGWLATNSEEPAAEGTRSPETRLLEQFPLVGDEAVLLHPGLERFGEHAP